MKIQRSGIPQLTAFFTSAPILTSSAAVNSATINPLPEDLTLKIRELKSEVSDLKMQVEGLTKFSKEHSTYSAMAVGHVLDGMSILRYYSNRKGIEVDDLDGAFESIGDLQNLHDSRNFPEIRDEIENYMGRLMGCIIELCGARIGSTELLGTLKERFDRDTLLTIVNLDDVVDIYGFAEAHEWEHRLHS